MCLAVPGKVVRTSENTVGMLMGTVSFSGVVKEVCLAFLPEIQPGDYVLVHAGFAISRVDEAEAQEVLRTLEALGEAAGDAS